MLQASDNVNGIITSRIACNETVSRKYQLGVTLINCNVSDSAKNVAYCSFTINVTDGTPPNVTCPSNADMIFTDPLGIQYKFDIPTADLRGSITATALSHVFYSNITSNVFSDCGPQPDNSCSHFSTSQDVTLKDAPAVYDFTYSAVNNRSLTTTCKWNITLRATGVAPNIVFGCNSTAQVPVYTIYGFADLIKDSVKVAWPDFIVSSSSAVTFATTSSPASHLNGSTFNFGTPVTMNFKATDSFGLSSECTFFVVVLDDQKPTISFCPTSFLNYRFNLTVGQKVFSATNDAQQCQPLKNCLPPVSSVDNTQAPLVSYTAALANTSFFAVSVDCVVNQQCTRFSGTFPVGVTQVIYSARDVSNNTANCTYSVEVMDTQLPIITGCTGPYLFNTIPNQSDAFVSCPAVTASDNDLVANFTGNTVLLSFCGRNHGVGNYSFTFTAIDASNNIASCTLQIVVQDVQNPIYSNENILPSNIIQGAAADADFATINFAGIQVTDNSGTVSKSYTSICTSNCIRNITSDFIQPEGVNLTVGNYVVTFVAADPYNNRLTYTFTISVVDTQPPKILNCPSNMQVASDTNGEFELTWPRISATDNVGIKNATYNRNDITLSQTRASVILRIGIYTLIYTVVDRFNLVETCNFLVAVFDDEPPLIDPSCTVSVDKQTNSSSLNVSWFLPNLRDNSGFYKILNLTAADRTTGKQTILNATAILNVTTKTFTSNFEVGSYTITYTVGDGAVPSNKAYCEFSMKVTELPRSGTASESVGAQVAIAAGSALGGLILCLFLFLALQKRKFKEKMQRDREQYAALFVMSDVEVLEKSRLIQQTLLQSKQVRPPPTAAPTDMLVSDFVDPPKTTKELEYFLKTTLNKHTARNSLEIGNILGKGEFGEVNEGNLLSLTVDGVLTSNLKVAVKQLKNSKSDQDRVRFLKEAAIMGQFDHANIVRMYGVVLDPRSEPTMLVLEYMHIGSLEEFLQSPIVKDSLTSVSLVRMAIDISAGMNYLANAGFVHRDLAARNILLDKEMTCRIGDFGLSVGMGAATENDAEGESIYSGSEDVRIPIRWSAIEALLYRQFSTPSDVWSFGVVMWEIFSFGELPYRGMDNKMVAKSVMEGFRLPLPADCPEQVYAVMIACWHKIPLKRPTFVHISTGLVDAWRKLQVKCGFDAFLCSPWGNLHIYFI